MREAPPGGEARFPFGETWSRFLGLLDEERIVEAERSLQSMLRLDDLHGRSFLDVGCGSGLFSLAAMRMGAARVHSFDLDAQSVACAAELKRRYLPRAATWTLEAGSALDRSYLEALGRFDVVYAWGVLQHTGDMFRALENVADLPEPGGLLFVAIHNDDGVRSRAWRVVKRSYSRLPRPLRGPYVIAAMAPRWFWDATAARLKAAASLLDMRLMRSPSPANPYRGARGMSRWYDAVQWVGGYPFEVAAADVIFDFYDRRGFSLTRLRTSRTGNNEYTFRRSRET